MQLNVDTELTITNQIPFLLNNEIRWVLSGLINENSKIKDTKVGNDLYTKIIKLKDYVNENDKEVVVEGDNINLNTYLNQIDVFHDFNTNNYFNSRFPSGNEDKEINNVKEFAKDLGIEL